MKRTIISLFLLLCLFVTGCATETEQPESSVDESSVASIDESGSESTTPDVSEPDESISDTSDVVGNLNLLTGISDLPDNAVGKRPVAVMVNNISAAMPQYGIETADIIYEIPVEGYQTRFMCIYADYTQLPEICSVRSCRKYFPALAHGYGAVYVNFGQNSVINSYVKSIGIVQYNGVYYGKNLFDRDQNRLDEGYAKEHTLYFKGQNFPAQLEKDNVDMNLPDDKNGTAFKFNPEGEQIAPSEEACTDIYINFGSNKSGFIYNPDTKTYLKTFYNRTLKDDVPQIDGRTEAQLEFTNIFVLHNDVMFDKTAVYNAKGDMHRKIDWQGGTNSKGYYISNGAIQEIYWIKKSESDSIKFYDKQGNELSVNCGKSYITFTDTAKCEFND